MAQEQPVSLDPSAHAEDDSAATDSFKKFASAKEVVEMDKYIAFCDNIMDLLQKRHGVTCARPNCGKSLDYRLCGYMSCCFLAV